VSYIAGIRKIQWDESQGWKIPSAVTGDPIESNITSIMEHEVDNT